MTQRLDNQVRIHQDPLLSLAARLTDTQDRETYAALISYFRSLPPGDELFRLAELLGFLSLLGQRLPDALAGFLEAVREQTRVTGEYHTRLGDRLAYLPKEIAEGVDLDAIAKAMSERFRQQLTASGLQDTAALLNGSVSEIKTLFSQLAAGLQPYKGIGTTISAELVKLTAASRELQQQNTVLIAREREQWWLWKGLLGLTIFLIGGVCGILLEKRQTVDVMSDLDVHVRRIENLGRVSMQKNSR